MDNFSGNHKQCAFELGHILAQANQFFSGQVKMKPTKEQIEHDLNRLADIAKRLCKAKFYSPNQLEEDFDRIAGNVMADLGMAPIYSKSIRLLIMNDRESLIAFLRNQLQKSIEWP